MKSLVIAIILVLLVFASVFGQDKPIVLKSNLVILEPIVLDPQTGNQILDLEQKDFEIYDNGVKQDIALFRVEPRPTDYVIAINDSASMSGQRNQIAKEVAKELIFGNFSSDETTLVRFNEQVNILHDRTSYKEILVRCLEQLKPVGGASMFQTIHFGLYKLHAGKVTVGRVGSVTDQSEMIQNGLSNVLSKKKALVIITASPILDMSCAGTWKFLFDNVREFPNIPIYIIQVDAKQVKPMVYGNERYEYYTECIGERSVKNIKEMKLEKMAEFFNKLVQIAGGGIFTVGENNVRQTIEEVAEQIRKGYILGFYPSDPVGGRHSLTVKVSRKGRALDVHCRNSYEKMDVVAEKRGNK